MFDVRIRARVLLMLFCIGGLGACSAQHSSHGYTPSEEDLAELVVGVDTRATVDDVVGAPSVSGMMNDGNYYYVRSRIRYYGAFAPEVVDREVLAISFDQSDAIANIERFGLEDGRVIRLTRRVTDSSVVDTGFLRQMMGNLGNLNPAELFN